jgi:hypothetical protein
VLLTVVASLTAVGCASVAAWADERSDRALAEYHRAIEALDRTIAETQAWLGDARKVQFVPGVSAHQIGAKDDPFHLNLQAESRDHYGSGAAFEKRERQRRAVAFEGGLELGPNAALEFEGDLVDSLRATEDGPWSRISRLFSSQQTEVARTEFRLGLADNRIRLRSSQAVSQFDASRALTPFNESDKDASSDDDLALEQAIEADLVRDGDWLVSTFVRRSLVDDAFHGLRGEREDPRGRNRHTVSVGGTVGWGPFGATFARETGERVRDGDGYQEQNLRTTFSVGLDDLSYRAGLGTLPGLAPDAVWVSLAEGDVDPGGAQTSTRDRTTEHSFGLSWAWDSAYTDLSFWRYLYDGRQPYADQADWLGHGAVLGVGTYGANWNVDASLGFDLGDNKEPYSRSRDTNFYGGVSVAHQPENLPDLRLSFFVGSYKSDYLAYQGEVHSRYGEFSAEADFSKFLMADDDDDGPSLALISWFRGQTTKDSFADGEKQGQVVVGVVYKKLF